MNDEQRYIEAARIVGCAFIKMEEWSFTDLDGTHHQLGHFPLYEYEGHYFTPNQGETLYEACERVKESIETAKP